MKQAGSRTKSHFVAYVAASVDGRISVSNDQIPDWTSSEDWNFFQNSLAKADAVVVGRNTYELVSKSLSKRNTFVFTHQVETTSTQGSVTFVNPTGANIAEILSKHKNVAVIGGESVYRFMLDEGLLDEIYLTIEPIILGRGIGIFESGSKKVSLELISSKHLNDRGTFLLHYRVDRD